MEVQRPRAWVRSPAHEAAVGLLVSARKRAGLSQRELAAKINTRQSLVARLESGQRALSLLEFLAICLALEVDPASLIEDLKSELSSDALAHVFPAGP